MKNSGEPLDGSSVALKLHSAGVQGLPSVAVQHRLRPSAFSVPTDTTTGEPSSCFSCPKAPPQYEKLISERVQIDLYETDRYRRDCHVHYIVCTYFGVPIKLFKFVFGQDPLSPFVRNTNLKKLPKLRTTP